MTFKKEEVGEILGIINRDKYSWGATTTTNSQRTETQNWESLKEWDAFLPGRKKKKELSTLAKHGLDKPWAHSTAKSHNHNLHLLWNCLLVSLCWENLRTLTSTHKSHEVFQHIAMQAFASHPHFRWMALCTFPPTLYHFNFTEMSAVVQRTSTICGRLRGLERWDGFHPRTRKPTTSSALFPTHSPISFGNYQRTFNEPTSCQFPLGAERFSLATKADRSPQTKYLILLHYALC